jgi:hypothetical protein
MIVLTVVEVAEAKRGLRAIVMFDFNDDAKTEFRRVEVLTGPGRRRRWSAEENVGRRVGAGHRPRREDYGTPFSPSDHRNHLQDDRHLTGVTGRA